MFSQSRRLEPSVLTSADILKRKKPARKPRRQMTLQVKQIDLLARKIEIKFVLLTNDSQKN
ncbi:MAG: hypothetical protein AVDCRST_MAG74-482 [uncultured Pyrinomonadaceae bacterium]|uniref:Uncharacterized protein n=1 Tax=uncultured Pyrinomonadaceae bacterium TaxID=2283094 RepID=A0A6J4NAA2_9BACT|nr:MAG: hypothetical protein AVDCRST_MAG74-482 [uncultured Pyrinomonadaceae bacterium]